MDNKTYQKMTEAQVRGRRIITRRPLSNSYLQLPTGSIATITNKRSGYDLTFDPCPHCGVKALLHKVSPRALDLLPENPEPITPPTPEETTIHQSTNTMASAAAAEMVPLFGCARDQCAEETSHTADQIGWSPGFDQEWPAGFYCLDNCLQEIDELIKRHWQRETSQARDHGLPEPPAPRYYAENPLLLSNFQT